MVTFVPVRPRARVMIAMPQRYPRRVPGRHRGTSGAAGLAVPVLEGARVLGNVDRVLLERGQGNDLECALVCGREHDWRREAVLVGAQPVRRRDAPAVSWHETREAVLRHRRAQVVADAPLVLKELARHHRAAGVAAPVLWSGVAAAVPVEAGERVSSTWLKLAAEHIPVSHPRSINSSGPRPQPSAAELRHWIPASHIIPLTTSRGNGAFAAKPCATGTSTAGFGRIGRCHGAGTGSVISRAIISSVTSNSCGSSALRGPGGAGESRAGDSRRSPGLRAGEGVQSVTVHSPRPTATIIRATAAQASGLAPEAVKATQASRPARAAAACPKINCGGSPPALARSLRRPPRATQVRSMKAPRLAVTSQLTRAASRIMSRVCPPRDHLTIVNDIVNYCCVRHYVDMTAGSVIEALSDPTRRQIMTLLR